VPQRNAVRQLIKKLQETGSVFDATRSGRPSILTEKNLLDISDRMLQSPKKSIRKLSQQVTVSYDTAHTDLKTVYAHTLTKLQLCMILNLATVLSG
jgi:transposase